MDLNNRQITMINMLLKEKKHKPAIYFAEKLGVSDRTIYSDLEKIEGVSENLGFVIERKKGLGILATQIVVNKMKQDIGEIALTTMYNVNERRIKILELLLFHKETYTYQNFADMFFVSKSSIHTDMLYIKNTVLNSSTIDLVSNTLGTRIEGTEEQFQNTLIRFNDIFKESRKKLEVLEFKDKDEYILIPYYGKKIITLCQDTVYDFISNNTEAIAEYYIENIINRLIVIAYRARNGYHIESKASSKSEKDSNIFLTKLMEQMDITFTAGDIAYMNKHMKASKMKERRRDADYIPLIEKVIIELSHMIKVDFTGDQQLAQQLSKHFPPMVYRLKNNISIENPFLTQIKHDYSVMYNITWFIMEGLEEELQVTFTAKEIGFLTIYFQSTLERLKTTKRILIVCPTGITTSGILYNRIRQILPLQDKIEVSSFDELKKHDLDKVDFIISTAYLSVKDIPIIVVSPLLGDEDMRKVSHFYNATFVLKEQSDNEIVQYNFENVKQYIDLRFVEFGAKYTSQQKLIEDVTDRLIAAGFVESSFKKAVIERESSGGTNLPTGVAVPHGNPEYVKETIVTIHVNEKPIQWNGEKVQVVIFVCIAKKDLHQVKNIIASVYNLVENNAIVERIFIDSTLDNFIKLLGGEKID